MSNQSSPSLMAHLIQRCGTDGAILFWVKIHPSASRTHIKECMEDGTIKIDIAAPPEKGKANHELIRFLAEEFGVPRGYVEILCGETAKQKQIRVFSKR
ncbi:MAG TPA: DUF167 domain-containing protein [Candidatus Peribacterales bacterium]|nr:DUF167 domain-containing protein [Candidatus Peribacterales bacterium]